MKFSIIIWNSAPVVCIVFLAWTCGLEFGLPPILDVVIWY